MEIVITRAVPADTKRVATLLEQWLQCSRIGWPELEPDAVVEWVLHTIENGYVVVAEGGGRLLGSAAIQPCYLPWNTTTPMMRDAWFYVPRARTPPPDSDSSERASRARRAAQRAPGVADALMTAIKLYCAKREIPLLMEIISGTDTDRLDRWYGIKGGRYAGGTFVFGLPAKEN